jgi:hypothetical protein
MGCQLALLPLLIGAAAAPRVVDGSAAEAIVRNDDDSRLAYRLTRADQDLLDQVEHAAFLYFWREIGRPATRLA